ncbi:BREX-4 system phosphatase PglZ [uncultured Selenomonas sp.]|uniref:BREX-4 system phosphatase PglZ n=1 Tax=uncultured Selenomonas sp. TaxID=159275 RepID=UPI0025EAD51B|nr:BREX-4 system phosphatase PglZ [uncultured Selenomonas sp.]
MTIQEVVSKLQQEKQDAVASRFPCRAILVKNIRAYCDLLSELKKISDIHVVPVDVLFPSADVMPKFENLMDKKYRNEWLILTGVSEYLRLFARNEMSDRRFSALWHFNASASNIGRIIIPLWGCEAQWFDKSMNLTDDLRQEDFFYACSDPDAEEQTLRILVLSGKFETYVQKLENMQGDLKVGLKEWFEYWANPEDPNKKDFVLLTNRAKFVDTANGNISIHVMNDTLTFICENMPGADILTEENCSDEMQGLLLDYALKGVDLDTTILGILNMSTFSGIDAMGKWNALPDSHKQIIFLWLERHPEDTYLCHCFAASASVAEVPDKIMLEIFQVWYSKPEWIDEYRSLVNVMAWEPDDRFFRELDAIPVYEDRLAFMTGARHDERVYLLRMVGKWMRSDATQVLACEKLKDIYPELYYYLHDDELAFDDDIKLYMERYKSYKLSNTLPMDEASYFNGIQTDTYDMRHAVLSDYMDSDTEILWIDALGIEWLPLLRWGILQHCNATIKHMAIGQANLPTETMFNDPWKVMDIPHEKLDKLDKLAHKGLVDDPDYYACIEDQLTFVSSVYKTVSQMMEKHHRVIITGDHGTSRLAARFFHQRDGIDVHHGVKVYSHGRYSEWKPNGQPQLPAVRVVATLDDGKKYAVFENYDHFTTPGFAAGGDDENAIYGEVHGGASPEEMLVPILVVDSNQKIPLTADWEKATVKISRKKARFGICFNQPVHSLQIRIAGIDGAVNPTEDAKRWTAEFSRIKPGTYPPQIFANNTIVSLPDVTIKSALGGGEGDLP